MVTGGGEPIIADLFVTLSRRVSSKPLLLFLEALLLGKAAPVLMLYGKYSESLHLEIGVALRWISFCEFCYKHARCRDV